MTSLKRSRKYFILWLESEEEKGNNLSTIYFWALLFQSDTLYVTVKIFMGVYILGLLWVELRSQLNNVIHLQVLMNYCNYDFTQNMESQWGIVFCICTTVYIIRDHQQLLVKYVMQYVISNYIYSIKQIIFTKTSEQPNYKEQPESQKT